MEQEELRTDYFQKLLTDSEIAFYLDEKERTIRELKLLNKEKRNKQSSELEYKYKYKTILENDLEYYNMLLSLASERRIQYISKEDKRIIENVKKEDVSSDEEGIFSKIIDSYYKKQLAKLAMRY